MYLRSCRNTSAIEVIDIQRLMISFQHIPEQIFDYLDEEDIAECRLVSHFWKDFIDHSRFWRNHWVKKLSLLTSIKAHYMELDEYDDSIEPIRTLLEMYPQWVPVLNYYRDSENILVLQKFVYNFQRVMNPSTRCVAFHMLRYNPFLLAIQIERTELLKLFAKCPIKVDFYFRDALELACRLESVNMVKFFLDHLEDFQVDFGRVIKSTRIQGNTILHRMAQKFGMNSYIGVYDKDAEDCLRLLLDKAVEKGCKLSPIDNWDRTPFQELCQLYPSIETLDFWLDYPQVRFNEESFDFISKPKLHRIIHKLYEEKRGKGKKISSKVDAILKSPRTLRFGRLYHTALKDLNKEILVKAIVQLYRERRADHLHFKKVKKIEQQSQLFI